MKKILVPTDFSANAWDALTYAIRLYDHIPARFYILNTYDALLAGANFDMQPYTDSKLLDLSRDNSEKELKKIKTHLEEHLLNDNHEYEIISKLGSLTTIVEEIVKEENIHLIIMGTTGASGLREFFLGSNTVDVINRIDSCPVIAVPKNYEYKEPEKIDFATNLKVLYTKENMRYISELSELHNLSIEVLHVKKEKELDQTQKSSLALLKIHLKNYNFNYKEIEYPTNSIADSITSYCIDQEVNMICLANYEHSLFDKLTHEAVVKKVGFHTEVPLMVFSIKV